MIFIYITYLLYIFYIYIIHQYIIYINIRSKKRKMNNWVPQFSQISYIVLTLDGFFMLVNSE